MSDDLMKRSVDQGLEYLKSHKGESVVFGISNGFNYASAETPGARGLEDAIDHDVGHSGSSFGYALKEVLQRAATELHGEIKYQDKDGKDCAIDPASTKIPNNTARLVLKL